MANGPLTIGCIVLFGALVAVMVALRDRNEECAKLHGTLAGLKGNMKRCSVCGHVYQVGEIAYYEHNMALSKCKECFDSGKRKQESGDAQRMEALGRDIHILAGRVAALEEWKRQIENANPFRVGTMTAGEAVAFREGQKKPGKVVIWPSKEPTAEGAAFLEELDKTLMGLRARFEAAAERNSQEPEPTNKIVVQTAKPERTCGNCWYRLSHCGLTSRPTASVAIACRSWKGACQ